MYAMCNLHDVTWLVYFRVSVRIVDILSRGTKGDNGSTKDLGGAKKVKGENGQEFMEVELPTAREDVDQLWAASRSALRTKPQEVKEHRDAQTKQADHDRNSRTNVVLAWVGSNITMILIFTSTAFTNWVDAHVEKTDDTTFNPYLTVLFIALCVAVLVALCTKLADFDQRQGRIICHSFRRLVLIFNFPIIWILNITERICSCIISYQFVFFFLRLSVNCACNSFYFLLQPSLFLPCRS
jgi:hypothetical protein